MINIFNSPIDPSQLDEFAQGRQDENGGDEKIFDVVSSWTLILWMCYPSCPGIGALDPLSSIASNVLFAPELSRNGDTIFLGPPPRWVF
ncbi:hypothetical protein CAEBREN_07542 [Caenorhabditis brenneri]|uniref:Uncharacterized protein n=1 Tax=Caenorhabditis brenneri TaxID=135651 RepID=G0MFB5_CAEBE|nr:hypothetical protein CAEBREN_07542 [Caenorhabditis brenneri]